MLTVLLDPPEVRGAALLIREHADRPDEQWFYLPAIRRTKRVLPVRAHESFLGSDFSLADLGFVDLKGHQFTLLGEETIRDQPALKIEEQLAPPHYFYSRVVSWVAKDTSLPLRRDFYDGANQLWKTESYLKSVTIAGIPTVLRVVMEDKQLDTTSELRVTAVRYDAAIPDDLFDPDKLSMASAHTLWRAEQ